MLVAGKSFKFPEFRLTESGIRVDLDKLYLYSDHANITFKDGTNWPLGDDLEAIQAFAGLLRRMHRELRKASSMRTVAEKLA